ncbi:MAG: SMC-Scp complex subunit ScpB [Candidatus Neomarinimicrobiota bacterium]
MKKNAYEREEIRIIEALLFSSPDVLTQAKMELCFDEDAPQLDHAILEIQSEYERQERSFIVEKVAGGYRLVTRPEYEPWVKRLHTQLSRTSLSRAALEAVAVIAYKGPASRAEIESIRGVDSTSVIKTLLEKKLVAIRGRADSPGRPLLYVTTDIFLTSFGLESLSDLPKLREISELVSKDPDKEESRTIKISGLPESKPGNEVE